ncbi:MAG: cupin-like domain-containing protein [Alphaproteobacteria bacterium]|nr:cupin-like domain-containing protein [Alphaproteobacteria bacterium]
MTREFQKIPEWSGVTFEIFRDEIYPRSKPAVLRGLVQDWSAAREGSKSPRAFCDYVRKFDRGGQVNMLTAPPDLQGRFFYSDDLRGYNFERRKVEFATAVAQLLAQIDDENPSAVYVESAPITECMPDFARANVLDLVDPGVVPRIWMGNRIRTQTHYDLSDNIACVVAGRRRFTLFPPDQIANLYMGPLEFTISGAPVSMASLEEPDFARHPRFSMALDAAQAAELGPGDAIFIPYFWWHHVRSLEPFNALVNYWWNDAPRSMGSLYDCLLHGVLAIRDLPADQRTAWRSVFDYLVFKTSGEPMAHLPPHARGALGPMTLEQREHMKKVLLHSLERTVTGR